MQKRDPHRIPLFSFLQQTPTLAPRPPRKKAEDSNVAVFSFSALLLLPAIPLLLLWFWIIVSEQPPVSHESPAKFGAVSAISNLAFATGKILVGVAGSSYALIADGIESIADVFSSLIVWNGLRVASKEPDQEHPYGHGKAESVAGLIAACALLVSAIVISVNAIRELMTEHEAPELFVMPALVVIIVAKEILFRWLNQASDSANSGALKIEAWHHRMDSLTSLGVLVGVVIAAFGGQRFAGADDVAALLVSGLIAFNAFRLAKPSVDELLDRSVEGDLAEQIDAIAQETPGLHRLESLQVRKSGAQHLVDVHLEVDGNLTVIQGHAIAHDLKNRLLARPDLRITHVMTHVEPAKSPKSETGAVTPPEIRTR